MQSVHYRILRSHKDTLHGPSDRIRTCGCAAQAPAQPGGDYKWGCRRFEASIKLKMRRHRWCLPIFGPSDRIRTCGILLPKQARYQLRYTRTSSEYARSIPPLGIAEGFAHRLHIRSRILPLRIKPALLGFDSVFSRKGFAFRCYVESRNDSTTTFWKLQCLFH